jgi:hypothetical protein
VVPPSNRWENGRHSSVLVNEIVLWIPFFLIEFLGGRYHLPLINPAPLFWWYQLEGHQLQRLGLVLEWCNPLPQGIIQ